VRCVFDTNVVVSAVLFAKSIPGWAFRHALRNGRILLSKDTVAELVEVLTRPKFDRYVLPEERSAFLRAVIEEGELVEISQTVVACRDPKYDRFLEVAVCGSATHLVSGDEDLLVLSPFQGIPIVTPASFLNEVDPDAVPPA